MLLVSIQINQFYAILFTMWEFYSCIVETLLSTMWENLTHIVGASTMWENLTQIVNKFWRAFMSQGLEFSP